MGDQRTWIFQANPDRYRISDSLRSEEREMWNLNQHTREVHAGDRVFIWISGESAGIYAVGTVTSEPVKMPDTPTGQGYWRERQGGKQPRPRVDVKYTRKRLDRPLLREFMLADPVLRDLEIIKSPRGTNFPVSERECEAITRWLDDADDGEGD